MRLWPWFGDKDLRQIWKSVLAGVVLALAAPAAAQDAAEEPLLFVTPMGEPVRVESGSPLDAWIGAADSDGDGRVSYAEHLANALAFFPQLDSNGDNAVTSVESMALWNREAPELFISADQYNRTRRIPRAENPNRQAMIDMHRAAGHYDQVDEPMRGAQPFSLLNDVEPVMTCDRNFDRRVRREEFEACAAHRFVQIDIDRDGFFVREEADWPK